MTETNMNTNMKKETSGLDEALRSALQRQEVPDGFADQVMARVAAQKSVPQLVRRASWLSLFTQPIFTQPIIRWAALAAFATVMIFGVHLYEMRRERAEGEAAKQRLMLALRVAGSKLQLAKAKVNEMNANENQNRQVKE
jgi:hypothetical protein